jgi:Domain of unknown function (DUF4270)
VYRRILQITAVAAVLTCVVTACNKLDTTDIGSGLIPPVDNVKTFDTLLTVVAAQGFEIDSTKVSSTEDLPLGFIATTNDPVFGKTTANLFLQFKPAFFPYNIGNANDTLNGFGAKLDSVVLCLSYRGFYGDSSLGSQIKLDVRTIGGSAMNTDFTDTALYNFKYRPTGMGNIIGSAVIDAKMPLQKVVFTNKRDSVVNQIRIKITDAAFINALYSRDTLPASANNSFRNDSLWKLFNRGFAITVDSNYSPAGKLLLYTNLTEATTRLEIHYQKRNNGKLDTVFTSLPFNRQASNTSSRSAYANNISRTYMGAEILSSPSPTAVYIQASPGTYAALTIPDLSTLSNRIIHRAELIMEQVPGNTFVDGYMRPPGYLYIDRIDTGGFFRPIPYDLAPDINYGVYPGLVNFNFNYFGGFVRSKLDAFGNPISFYSFNISRYVQGIVTRKENNLPLRLYAPFQLDYTKQLGVFGLEQFRNSIAFGRVKLGAGNNANYRMRLRIVYSRI